MATKRKTERPINAQITRMGRMALRLTEVKAQRDKLMAAVGHWLDCPCDSGCPDCTSELVEAFIAVADECAADKVA